jgi:16S rRNA (cytosine967-C5)-methyltransferase
LPPDASGARRRDPHGRAARAPADARLRQFFRARPQMGVQDRAFVAEGVFAFLRHRRSLEALAATSDPRLLALATLVRELGKSVREVDAALTSDEREWLAAFKARMQEPLADAIGADLPDWLWDRLGETMGAERRAAFARSAREGRAAGPSRQRHEGDARRRARGAQADGLAVVPTPYSPWGLRITGRRCSRSTRGSSTAASRSRTKAASSSRSSSRRAAARWSSTSARAPAARRSRSAR